MAKQWTKSKLDAWVEEHGGSMYELLETRFPFSKLDKQKINEAIDNEDKYTDSDVCDIIGEIAYARVIND